MMEKEKRYAIYDTFYDAFWYNNGLSINGSAASWTDSIRHAQLKETISDVFDVCCRLYEKDMYSFENFVVVEVTPVKIDGIICDTKVDFENPVWDGSEQKIIEFWTEVEPDLKHITVQRLSTGGLPQMHKLVLSWYQKGL